MAVNSFKTHEQKQLDCYRIGWALAKSYGDLFYTPQSLPHFLLLAKFSSWQQGY